MTSPRHCISCWSTQAACNAGHIHGDGRCCPACEVCEGETHDDLDPDA